MEALGKKSSGYIKARIQEARSRRLGNRASYLQEFPELQLNLFSGDRGGGVQE